MRIRNNFQLFFLTIILLWIGIGCSDENYMKEKIQYQNVISQIAINNTIVWIVIIPGYGCQECLHYAEEFMKTNINSKHVLFVLTNISSIKELEIRLNLKVADYSNIIIDRENKYYIKSENNDYPCIIKLKNGKINNHEFQNSKNISAFYRLKQKIND